MNTFPPISSLIPHTGLMCLLESIERTDAQSITCRTGSHHALDNPLRRDGQLAAVHAAEYAAQAVAVHGGLRTPQAKPRGGMVAVLTGIHWTVDRLDTVASMLTVTATRTADTAEGLAYAFRVEGDGRALVEGDLMIALQPEAA